MSLFAARQALNNLSVAQQLSAADRRSALTGDIMEEARERQREEEKRASGSGWGRLLGGGAGGLLGLALAPLTGGGSLATMLLAGAGGGLGSLGGQYAGGKLSGADVKIGDFNVSEDRRAEEAYNENMLGQAGMDALTAALTAGAFKGGGNVLDKVLGKTAQSGVPGQIPDTLGSMYHQELYGTPAWRVPFGR